MTLGEVASLSLIFLLCKAEYVLAYSVVHNVNHMYSLKFLVAMMKLILKDFLIEYSVSTSMALYNQYKMINEIFFILFSY